jgi:hypothetical protein
MEDQIKSTLAQIRDRVLGLSVYQYIYDEDHPLDRQMQTKIVKTYDTFISFCINATDFYIGGAVRKFRSLFEVGHLASLTTPRPLAHGCHGIESNQATGQHSATGHC